MLGKMLLSTGLKTKSKLLIAIIFLLGFQNNVFAQRCSENRAVIEFAPQAIEMLIASVNLCKNSVTDIVYEKLTGLAIKQDLDKSSDGNFSQTLQALIIQHLDQFYTDIKKIKIDKSIALFSAPFSHAKNGKQIIAELAKNYKFRTKMLSKEDEAISKFISTHLALHLLPDSFVQFEIESEQSYLTTYSKETKFKVQKIATGSVNFKNDVIDLILKQDYTKIVSPNPLGLEKTNKAIELATKYFTTLPKLGAKTLIGTGGVFQFSIFKQLETKFPLSDNKQSYLISDINSTIFAKNQLRDELLKAQYPDTEVTNLILVHQAMSAMGAGSITPAKTRTTIGAMLYSQFWN